jgi:hypothetical protein
MNLRGVREKSGRLGVFSSSFWPKELGIKREILVGAEFAKNARDGAAEAEVARKQIHRGANPPPVAICERDALFTGGQSEPE